jgi:hypothetical protein
VLLAVAASVCSLLVAAVLLLTSTVDRHAKQLQVKRERDTRLMLVHELRSRWVCGADGVILGSSRPRVLGHPKVAGLKLYSLTANGMAPREFAGYLDAWVERCRKQPKVVLLGLDFFGSSTTPMVPAASADEYITRDRSLAQYLGVFELLSTTRLIEAMDLLLDGVHGDIIIDAVTRRRLQAPPRAPGGSEEALDDAADAERAEVAMNEDNDEDGASRGEGADRWFETERYREISPRHHPVRDVDGTCLIPRLEAASDDEIALAIRPARFKHSRIYEDVYRQYELDPGYSATLRELKRRYPETRFVGFVTPTTHVLFALLVDLGRLPDYEAFLAAGVEGLGEVWEFGGLNAVTARRSNFRDENHLNPRAADVMLAIALGMDSATAAVAPAGFGVRLDATNLDAYFATLRARAARPRVKQSKMRAPPRSSISYEDVSSRRTPKHERKGDCAAPIDEAGIEIDVSNVAKTRRLEIGLHARVAYRIDFYDASKRVIGTANVSARASEGPGARTKKVDVPKDVRSDELAAIRIVATRGPEASRVLGHLRFI